jgi:hypothetical protein
MKLTAAINNLIANDITKKEPKFSCEFCNRKFLKETTILSHICEYKQRWLNKDLKGNRLGFQSWLQFYNKHTISKKQKTYQEFIKSAYYTAFVKFGNYSVDINALNVSRYVDWLLKNQIKIDTWCSDTMYNRYLCEYLRTEDPLDAVARSIEISIEKAKDEGILSKDYLRYGNSNKICYLITTGKISPWMLYQSESGTNFLDKLHPDQVKMIIDYINPEQWALKFKRSSENVSQVKQLLKQAGY